MSLADALARPAPPTTRCAVADLLSTLDEDDAKAVRAVMEPGAMDTIDLRMILAANGHVVPTDPIRYHKRTIARQRGLIRNGIGCSCP